MSETRLREIRARLEAAIPGPWRVFQDYDDEWFILLDHADGGIVATIEPGRTEGSDAALIAHAPADLAYLLDAVTRLTRELEEARRERSAARAEALTAQASLRRVERELEEARERLKQYQRLVVFADSVARARGDACGLCDALGRDDQPYQSHRAADLIAEAERALIARTNGGSDGDGE